MPRVTFQKAYLSDVLEYFRMKGTQELRKQQGNSNAVLKFDYDFDPTIKRPVINYDQRDTSYGGALRGVLDQQGLVVEVIAPDRMRISDASGAE